LSQEYRKTDTPPEMAFTTLVENGTQQTIVTATRDYAPVSRSRISELTGIPHAAVSRCTARLIEKRLLCEEALADKTGPRRKKGLCLNPQLGHVLAVAYYCDRIEGAIVNTAYEAVLKKSEAIALGPLPQDEKVQQIIRFAQALRQEAKEIPGRCLGLAMVDPGLINAKEGKAVWAAHLENWNNVPLAALVEEAMQMPVMLLNTLISTIRAIDRLEVPGHSRNLLCIEYSTQGIGCGMKLEGHYICGASNVAGEFGHFRVTDEAVNCKCGGQGCLEAVASIPALAEQAALAVTGDSYSMLAKRESIDGVAVLKACAQGDRLAARIVERAYTYLANAASGLICTLDPELVVFSHPVMLAGEEAVKRLISMIQRNVAAFRLHPIEVRVSSQVSHVSVVGGAAAVLDRCLQL